jgi:hypothetical protein
MQPRLGIVTRLAALFVLFCPVPAAQAQPSNPRILRLFLPHLNSFYLQPSGEPYAKVNTGFWGLGVGLLVRHSPPTMR